MSDQQKSVRVALLDSDGNNMRVHYLTTGEPGYDVPAPGVFFAGFRLDWEPDKGWEALRQNQPNATAELQAERDRLRSAAKWLVDNRGHRGEEQAWKLLADALGEDA